MLYSASLLIDMFADADLHSFADIERIRIAIEENNLLVGLNAVRAQVGVDLRPMVFAAESVLLRIAHGPLDLEDATALQEAVIRLNLAGEIEAIAER